MCMFCHMNNASSSSEDMSESLGHLFYCYCDVFWCELSQYCFKCKEFICYLKPKQVSGSYMNFLILAATSCIHKQYIIKVVSRRAQVLIEMEYLIEILILSNGSAIVSSFPCHNYIFLFFFLFLYSMYQL